MQSTWSNIQGVNDKYEINREGEIRNVRTKKLVKINKDRNGYPRAVLHNGVTKQSYTVHRLIAIAFIPNPDNKPQINHKNSIRHDNSIDNLEWCTSKENINHSFKNGRMPTVLSGEDNPGHILNAKDIPVIREMSNKGCTLKSIAEKFGVSLSTIYNIKIGKKWRHIP